MTVADGHDARPPVAQPPVAQLHVLTLCTGNAARSVMAGLLLSGGPVRVTTAGTFVVEGQPMSHATRTALAAVGIDAGMVHRSHQLADDDVARADLVVAMAGEHVAYVRRHHPAAAARTATMRRLVRDLSDGPEPLAARVAALGLAEVDLEPWEDVEDPAGGDDAVYLACAKELVALATDLIPRLR